MIEKIDIKDASIAETIRMNMNVATTMDKGLTPSQQALAEYVIKPNESIRIILSYGIYLFVSKQIDGTSLLFQFAYRSSDFKIVSDPSIIIGNHFNITHNGDGTGSITITNIRVTGQSFLLNRL